MVDNSIAVFIDADRSHGLADIPKLVDPIKKKIDNVQGLGTTRGSYEYFEIEKLFKVTGSQIISILINELFNKNLYDFQNGFRAIKTQIFKKRNLKESILSIELGMIIKTFLDGFTLKEALAHECQRTHGLSKITLEVAFFPYIFSCLSYLYFTKQ